MAEPLLDTSERFGFEWDRYRRFFPHYEQQFRGWIAPLEPDASPEQGIDTARRVALAKDVGAVGEEPGRCRLRQTFQDTRLDVRQRR